MSTASSGSCAASRALTWELCCASTDVLQGTIYGNAIAAAAESNATVLSCGVLMSADFSAALYLLVKGSQLGLQYCGLSGTQRAIDPTTGIAVAPVLAMIHDLAYEGRARSASLVSKRQVSAQARAQPARRRAGDCAPGASDHHDAGAPPSMPACSVANPPWRRATRGREVVVASRPPARRATTSQRGAHNHPTTQEIPTQRTKTGKPSTEMVYGVTDHSPESVGASQAVLAPPQLVGRTLPRQQFEQDLHGAGALLRGNGRHPQTVERTPALADGREDPRAVWGGIAERRARWAGCALRSGHAHPRAGDPAPQPTRRRSQS